MTVYWFLGLQDFNKPVGVFSKSVFIPDSEQLALTGTSLGNGVVWGPLKKGKALMRNENEGRKKQARSCKQQGKATQHTQGSNMYIHIYIYI